MKEPANELKADAEDRDPPPDVDALTSPDDLGRGERTRDDFFDTVIGPEAAAGSDAQHRGAGPGADHTAIGMAPQCRHEGTAVDESRHPAKLAPGTRRVDDG